MGGDSKLKQLFEERKNEIIEELKTLGYRLEEDRQIGYGAFALVYVVTYLQTKLPYAAKIILCGDALSAGNSGGLESQIRDEIKLMKKYGSMHYMLPLITHVITRNFVLIIMEYCPGGSLEIYTRGDPDRQLNEQQLKTVCNQILIGINNLHKDNNLHRDLKPENILIDRYGELRVADLGLAYDSDGKSKISLSSVKGTDRYLSPEVFNQVHGQSVKSDVWAVGVILFELILSRKQLAHLEILKLKKNKVIKRLRDLDYSPELKDFVSHCLDSEYESRPDVRVLMNHPWLSGEIHSTIFPKIPQDKPKPDTQHLDFNDSGSDNDSYSGSDSGSDNYSDDNDSSHGKTFPKLPQNGNFGEDRNLPTLTREKLDQSPQTYQQFMDEIVGNIKNSFGFLDGLQNNDDEKFDLIKKNLPSKSFVTQEEIITQISNCLKRDNGIIFEDMDLSQFSNDFWDPFSVSLSFLRRLETLNFLNCQIHDYAFGSVSLSLNKLTNLVDLQFSNNKITDKSIFIFCQSVTNLINLTILDLDNNQINVDGCKFLSRSFKYITKLERLDLSNNQFGEEGVRIISDQLKYLVKIQELLLTGEQMTDNGLNSIVNNFKYLPELQSLALSDNMITNQGIYFLCSNCKYITKLTILLLSKNNFDDAALTAISVNIDNLASISRLSLENNKLSNSGINLLNNCMKIFTNLHHLLIGGNYISDDGIISLARNLNNTPELRTLKLNDLNLSDHCVDTLSFHFEHINKLEVLNLNKNNFTDKGMEYLSQTIKYLKNLKSLFLSSNQIHDEGFMKIFQEILKLPLLDEVSFAQNYITKESIPIILDGLKSKKWSYFSIEKNDFDEQRLEEEEAEISNCCNTY